MFDVFFNESVVGSAQVEKDGLYYCIHCACEIPGDGLYRIILNDGENSHNLGICVPNKDKFVVNKRIPAKYIIGENLTFQLVLDANNGIAVATGKPFAHLDKLETAHLLETNGQSKIIIAPVQDQQDSDPIPAPAQIWESE